MADADFVSLSSLKLQYPSVPSTVVLKVINQFKNDHEKCKQALEVEKTKYPSEDGESCAIVKATNSSDSSNNAESSTEVNSVSSCLRELQVTHQSAKPGERHISTLQRSVGTGASQTADTSKPRVGQSVSWTVQATNRQTSLTSGSSAQYTPTFPSAAPNTAPADFTPFLFAPTVNDIPQIGCNAHTGRLQQVSATSSSTNSPVEQRRPVKVINIPPGSLSGGSVSPAATPPNSRHIRMHFGDTGGVCTVSGPPSTFDRQNANSHFRTELHTETAVPPPVHSTSIFVNTTNASQTPLQATPVASGHTIEGRRAVNPPMSLNTSLCDNQKSSGHNGIFSSYEPLSFPVQASSPGTVNSKPMFVETKRETYKIQEDVVDNSNQPSYFSQSRSLPPAAGYAPMHSYSPMRGQDYPSQYCPEFMGPSGYAINQSADQFNPQQQYLGYTGPPINLYPQPISSGINQNPYFSPMYNYPGGPMVMPISGSASNQVSQYGYSPHGQSTTVSRLSNRSDSQDSEHSSGTDPRISFNTSRVSSHNSPSSEGSTQSLDRIDEHQSIAGSLQEESTDYVRALLQHQKSRWQKMFEENTKLGDILTNLRKEVSSMEKNMTGSSRFNSFPSADDIAKLCEKNRSLQTDIQMYMNVLEIYKQGQVPINEMNPHDQQNFFENMPTGQQDPIYSRTTGGQQPVSASRVPPPRPPPPIPVRQRSTEGATVNSSRGGHHFGSTNDIYRVPPVPPPQPTTNSGECEEGERWNCKACTFLNFPALKECEICGLLRDEISPSSASMTFSSSGSSTHRLSDGGPPAIPPHRPLINLPPRLAQGLVAPRSRSPSASDMFGRHHHPHEHTGELCYCHMYHLH
ncbi:tgf-beta-activated kinase 1 and map3k7-binding protein 2 [Plakobranchus ocellatus]|uniref:Tgf-beta-activated kinase 1 and map3k7-binding protein 2 n=1 Tax=Plakobranchus ocellatus TaxID=259542 RepID=A0AAV3Z3L6_9GAST|nr:tgf-beta-activated kinase 1 and map3k7-binding protein 2 [Plakobranchus ocellatus]